MQRKGYEMPQFRDRRKPEEVPILPSPEICTPFIPYTPWLSARETAEALDVSRSSIRRYVKEGKLTCKQIQAGRKNLFFRREDVANLAESSVTIKRLQREALRNSLAGRLPLSMAVDPDSLVTPQVAAEILGTSIDVIRKYIYANHIFAFQDKPGHPGSRCYLLVNAVMRLKTQRDERKKKVEKHGNRRTTRNIQPAWDEARLPEYTARGSSPSAAVNHGKFVSTRQASIILGVNISTVNGLRARGRLRGFQFKYTHKIDRQFNVPAPQTRPSYWFFKREDIYKLQDDPEYIKRRKHWKYGLTEEARLIRQQKADEQLERDLEACMLANGFKKDFYGKWQKW